MAETTKPKKSLKDRAQELIQGVVDAVGALVPQPTLQPVPVRARPLPVRGRRR